MIHIRAHEYQGSVVVDAKLVGPRFDPVKWEREGGGYRRSYSLIPVSLARKALELGPGEASGLTSAEHRAIMEALCNT